MMQGVRTHEDYWAEIISGWPTDIPPDKLEFMRNLFYAGFALSSSFMGELKRSSITREEKVALHHFCMTECIRLSGITGEQTLVQERGDVTTWEP
jgi:hypothetical protein